MCEEVAKAHLAFQISLAAMVDNLLANSMVWSVSDGRYHAWVSKQTDHLRRPMSLLLAIMPGTRLRVFANRRWQLLELDVGDVLVFAGDVKHNGVGYAAEHLRIHAHLYPPGYDHVGEIQFSQADPVTGE